MNTEQEPRTEAVPGVDTTHPHYACCPEYVAHIRRESFTAGQAAALEDVAERVRGATAKGTAIDVDEWGRPLYVIEHEALLALLSTEGSGKP